MTMTDRMDNSEMFRPLGLDQAQTVGSSEGSKGDGGVAADAASSVMVERSGRWWSMHSCGLYDVTSFLESHREQYSAKRFSQTWIERPTSTHVAPSNVIEVGTTVGTPVPDLDAQRRPVPRPTPCIFEADREL
jgi:hypothetical protein